MRRWSFVFAVLVLSTTSVRASEPCACATEPVILPAPGAAEVPRNTKISGVGEALGQVRLEGGDEPWIATVDGWRSLGGPACRTGLPFAERR